MGHKEYALGVGQADLNRMSMLGNIYQPDNIQFILNCGLTSGMHVADIGCGPGNMSLWFAKKVGPTGSVTAIDNSDAQLGILKQQLTKHNISNVIPRNLDVYELSKHLEPQFDIVYCRFTMVHFNDPLQAMEQLQKILKPHGRLIVAELDNETWYSYPVNEYLKKDVNLLYKTGELRGIDMGFGKKLYSYFRKLQFNNIKVDIVQPILENENREYMVHKIQAWGKRYIEHQLITEQELSDLIDHIKLVVWDEDYLLAGAQMFQVSGTT